MVHTTSSRLLLPLHSFLRQMLRLIELEKNVVEGGGATGVAALLEDLLPELKVAAALTPPSPLPATSHPFNYSLGVVRFYPCPFLGTPRQPFLTLGSVRFPRGSLGVCCLPCFRPSAAAGRANVW
jgi:hypothetical protein